MLHAKLLRPLTASLVALFLLSCGGGGGGDTPIIPVGGTPASSPSKVFVGDSATAAIGSVVNPTPPAGPLVVDRIISGAATQLTTSMFDFAIDATNDRLYVSDLRNVLVFNSASTITGNVAPSRVVTSLASTSGAFNGGVYLDTAGTQRLYVAVNDIGATQTVQVFDNASTATNASATRTITFTMASIVDIAVDTAHNILYVYGSDAGGFKQILSFNNASTLNGPVVPDRTISFNDSGGAGPIGIFVDGVNDRLWVPRNAGTIAVFDVASTVNGSVTTTAVPPRTINLNPLTLGYSVAFVELASNRLYTLDPNGVNLIANASTVNGTPPSITRAIAPGGSSFRAIVVKP